MGQIQRHGGLEANKGTLIEREEYFCTDSKKKLIGNSNGIDTELVNQNDPKLTDQRTPLDGSVTYLKFISSLKAWQYANGYEADAELISRHRWLPNNYSILDAHNNYHQMVEINRKNWDSTNEFAAATIHDAFMVGGVQKQLFISKGPAVDDGLGNPVTWLDRIPMVNKTFDQELAACAALNNGTTITGFHQMTLPEWALMMQIIKNSGVIVRGNNNWGQDVNDKSITFHLNVPAAFSDHVSDGKHYTGSGGTKTSHDNLLDGIYDLTGGVWQRIAGCQIVNGEIQIINQNDAANSSLDQTDASVYWKAILEDGTLVAPGTVNTLKFSVNGNITKAAPAAISSSKAFDAIGCEADVLTTSTGITLLKKIGLYPYTTSMGGWFWFNTSGAFVPLRGAGWNGSAYAAVPALNCSSTRAYASWNIGFRAAFVRSL